MKKRIIVATIAALSLGITACGSSKEETTAAIASSETTVEQVTTATPTTEEITTEESSSEIIEVPGKSVADITLNFSDSVRNDVTGRWRKATTSDGVDFVEYALSYYKNYFVSDDEIHYVVDFSRNNTYSIVYMSGIIDVTVYERVNKEEHDAKLLGSGMKLAEYWIYEDGTIEKIE